MKIDLNELEALARAATPGRWESHHHRVCDEKNLDICRVSGTRGKYEHEKSNRDFIAATNPAAVLDLIALARQARAPVIPAQPGITDTVAIPLVEFKAAAQPVQQPTPATGSIYVTKIGDWFEGMNIKAGEYLITTKSACGAYSIAWVEHPNPPVRQPVPRQYILMSDGSGRTSLKEYSTAEFIDFWERKGMDDLIELFMHFKDKYSDARSLMDEVRKAIELTAAAVLEQAAQACDQQADGTNGPYRTACLQCANAVRELRDAAAAKGGA